MEVINASHIIISLFCVVVVKIIFLMCCGDNKGLEPYKYKERYLMALCLASCGNWHGTKTR